MSNLEKSVSRKAYRKCKKQGIPFCPSPISHPDADFYIRAQGFDRVVWELVQDCISWQRSYQEDAQSDHDYFMQLEWN